MMAFSVFVSQCVLFGLMVRLFFDLIETVRQRIIILDICQDLLSVDYPQSSAIYVNYERVSFLRHFWTRVTREDTAALFGIDPEKFEKK